MVRIIGPTSFGGSREHVGRYGILMNIDWEDVKAAFWVEFRPTDDLEGSWSWEWFPPSSVETVRLAEKNP